MKIKKLLLIVTYFICFTSNFVLARDVVIDENFLRGKNPVEFMQRVDALKKRFNVKYINEAVASKAQSMIKEAQILRGRYTDTEKAELMRQLRESEAKRESILKRMKTLEARLNSMGISSELAKKIGDLLKVGKVKEFEKALKAAGVSDADIKKLKEEFKTIIVPEGFKDVQEALNFLAGEKLDLMKLKDIIDKSKKGLTGADGLSWDDIEKRLSNFGFSEEEIEKTKKAIDEGAFDWSSVEKLLKDYRKEDKLNEVKEILEENKDELDDVVEALTEEKVGFTEEQAEALFSVSPANWLDVQILLRKYDRFDDFDEVKNVLEKNEDNEKEAKRILVEDKKFDDEQADELFKAIPVSGEPPPPPGFEEEGDYPFPGVETLQKWGITKPKDITDLESTHNLYKKNANFLKKALQKKEYLTHDQLKKLFSFFKLGEPVKEEVLLPVDIFKLSEKEKRDSDDLFVKALREASLVCEEHGKFKEYLKVVKDIFERIRKDKNFKKREEFDNFFKKTPEEDIEGLKLELKVKELDSDYKSGRLGAFLQYAIVKEFSAIAEKEFLDNLYKDFAVLEKSELLNLFVSLLTDCVFDKNVLNSFEAKEYILTLLINFVVTLRSLKKHGDEYSSDKFVSQLFIKFRDFSGPFASEEYKFLEKFGQDLEKFRTMRNLYKLKQKDINIVDKNLQDLNQKYKIHEKWKNEYEELLAKWPITKSRKENRNKLFKLVKELYDFLDILLKEKSFEKTSIPIKDELGTEVAVQANDKIAFIISDIQLLFEDFIFTENLKNYYEIINGRSWKLSLQSLRGDYQDLQIFLEKFLDEIKSWNISSFVDSYKKFLDKTLVDSFFILIHELNRLRVNKNFHNFYSTFNPVKAKKGGGIREELEGILGKAVVGKAAVGSKRVEWPKGIIPSSIKSLKLYSEDIQGFKINFQKAVFVDAIKNQLFFNPKLYWERIKEEVSPITGSSLNNFIDRVLNAYREYSLQQKGEFDSLDFVDDLKRVGSATELVKILESLGRQNVDQKILKQTLQMIDEAKAPEDVLKSIKTLAGVESLGEVEEELNKILKNYNINQEVIIHATRIIRELIGYDPKNPKKILKIKPSGRLFYEKLKGIPNTDINELDKQFKNEFRTPETIFRYIDKSFFKGEFKKYVSEKFGRLTKESFYELIEPYGILLRGFYSILQSTHKAEDKFIMLDFLLTDLNEGNFRDGQEKTAEWQEGKVTVNFSEYKWLIVEKKIYKGKLKDILKFFKKFDFDNFEKSLDNFIGMAGMGVENTENYQKNKKQVKFIFTGSLLSLLIKDLSTLNKGKGFIEDVSENIIPEVYITSGDVIIVTLHSKLYASLLGEFGNLLKMIDSIEMLKVLDLEKNSAFMKEIAKIKKTVEEKVLSFKDKEFEKEDRQKAIKAVNDYLDKKVEEIKKIKNSIQ